MLALVFAVLLVLSVLVVGCGGSETTTTTLAPTTTTPSTLAQTTTTTQAPEKFPATVTAQGLAVHTNSRGESEGAIADFSVQIDKRQDKKVAVGVREGEVSGTGDMWRAAAWTAPIVATDMLNLDLADYSIDYEVSGRIDGPSAGALMTIATLAAFLGDELDSAVTMTGTINPDYTVGPVGGIPHKLEGAADAGKTTVLVPLGERYDVDKNTGEWVDLVERGTELGLTVKEVADIYDAYTYFTGKEIPRGEAAATGTPALSPAVEKQLKECVEDNVSEVRTALQLYAEQSADAQAAFEDYAVAADDAVGQAGSAVTQGSMGAAYGHSQTALSYAESAYLMALAYDFADWKELALRLQGISPEADLNQLATKLVATMPETVGEASCIMDAWAMLTAARSSAADAAWALDQISSYYNELSDDELTSYMGQAIDGYVFSLVSKWAAEDDLKLADVSSGPEVVSLDRVSQMSEAYRRAAEANIAMLDSTVIPAKAANWGVSERDAQIIMAGYDSYYGGAKGAVNQIDGLISDLPEGVARDYAVLGASFLAFTGSAASLALNYDYQAQFDDYGNITGFRYDKSLVNALELARNNAESSIMSVEDSENATVVPWVWYEFANVDREGGPAEKISALFNYWNAHAQARTLRAISGALTPLVDD